MKIAMVSPTIPPNASVTGLIGGAETYVLNLSSELANLNNSVTLITVSRNGDGTINYNQDKNLEIKCLKSNALLSWGGQDPFSTQIVKTLSKDTYDVIHVHQIFTSLNISSCAIGKLRKIPSFATDHGGGTFFYRAIPTLPASFPNSFITVSKFSSQYLNNLAPKKKSFIAYAGVNTRVFNPDHNVGSLHRELELEGYKVILCVGRLLPSKGFDVAIRALNYLPSDTKLLIAGPVFDQEYAKYLQELASKFTSRVKLLGHVNADVLPKIYNLCDVFVQSSVNTDCFGHHYNFPELLGIAKLEAMACGKPVVVSNVGGLPEQVIGGEHGYIVKEKDEIELAKSVGTILSDDKLRKKMGLRSLELVQSKFSWRKVAERIVDFYNYSQDHVYL